MAAFAVAVLAPLGAGTAAEEPPTGSWARTPAQCRLPQDNPDAPFLLGPGKIDQYEAHCTFTGVRETGQGVWTARARCSIQGDVQTGTLRLALSGDRLAMTLPDGVTTAVRRCRS